MKYFIFMCCWTFCCGLQAQVIPLPQAHAHNDYNHENPLLDAMNNGFTSIEVDVLLIEDEIYVGHDLPEGRNELPTLKKLYLQPLDSIIIANGGSLYPGYKQRCFLMIDIKSNAEKTYNVLIEQLPSHKSWIRQYNGTEEGGITVFLSGNRPVMKVIKDSSGLVSLDGRPEDVGKGYSDEMMPVISQNYYQYSNWRGEGEMPEADQKAIRELASKVHQEGKKLRLWGHPDNENTWETLLSLGIDLINTDDLEGLKQYLLDK